MLVLSELTPKVENSIEGGVNPSFTSDRLCRVAFKGTARH